MSKNSIDFYETIRKINEQNRRLDGSATRDDDRILGKRPENTPDNWQKYLAGVLLLLWTISPVLTGFISSELMLLTLFCIYPLLSPFIWFSLGKWKPDGCLPTLILGSVSHVLLFYGVFHRLSGEVGNGYCFGFEIIVVMIIAAIIILSAIGSIFVILSSVSRS